MYAARSIWTVSAGIKLWLVKFYPVNGVLSECTTFNPRQSVPVTADLDDLCWRISDSANSTVGPKEGRRNQNPIAFLELRHSFKLRHPAEVTAPGPARCPKQAAGRAASGTPCS